MCIGTGRTPETVKPLAPFFVYTEGRGKIRKDTEGHGRTRKDAEGHGNMRKSTEERGKVRKSTEGCGRARKDTEKMMRGRLNTCAQGEPLAPLFYAVRNNNVKNLLTSFVVSTNRCNFVANKTNKINKSLKNNYL